MPPNFGASSIEVLSGLEPVRKRPGMYTDTSRPNHLAQEVIDNSVDEALAGHASSISVVLHSDGAIEVQDNGRGMPIDLHPEHGVSGSSSFLPSSMRVVSSPLRAIGFLAAFTAWACRWSMRCHGV